MNNTLVRNLVTRGRHFTIVKNQDGWYLAIEDKYITDGKINKTLTGIEMCASHTLKECLSRLNDKVEIAYLISQGYDKAEAFAMHFNMMDRIDAIRQVL